MAKPLDNSGYLVPVTLHAKHDNRSNPNPFHDPWFANRHSKKPFANVLGPWARVVSAEVFNFEHASLTGQAPSHEALTAVGECFVCA